MKITKSEKKQIVIEALIDLERGQFPEVTSYEVTALLGVIRGELYSPATNTPAHRILLELAGEGVCHYGQGRHRASLMHRYRIAASEVSTGGERALTLAEGFKASRDRRIATTDDERNKAQVVMVSCLRHWIRLVRMG